MEELRLIPSEEMNPKGKGSEVLYSTLPLTEGFGKFTFVLPNGKTHELVSHIANGQPDGLGVRKYPDGGTYTGERIHGAYDGAFVFRDRSGDIGYERWDRGSKVQSALQKKDGSCKFDEKECDAADERFCELKAAAREVEVLTASLPSTAHVGNDRTAVFCLGQVRAKALAEEIEVRMPPVPAAQPADNEGDRIQHSNAVLQRR